VLVELGIGARVPEYGHLPFVTGPGNKKLSKRDPGGGLATYRERGFLPEGLLNYLALLGWSIGGDREIFTLQEMADAFEISRVNPNSAQFDLRKCEAINAIWLRGLEPADFTDRLVPYLRAAGLVGDPLTAEQRRLLEEAAPLVQERMQVLGEAPDLLGFLFVPNESFAVDPDDATRTLTEDGTRVVAASYDAVAGLDDWSTTTIEAALRTTLIDGLGLKPRHAFGPVRVAVTGRRISPPLFESMELLGRERSLARLAAAREMRPA
jgi:glutamyl-tRNA synthetase